MMIGGVRSKIVEGWGVIATCDQLTLLPDNVENSNTSILCLNTFIGFVKINEYDGIGRGAAGTKPGTVWSTPSFGHAVS